MFTTRVLCMICSFCISNGFSATGHGLSHTQTAFAPVLHEPHTRHAVPMNQKHGLPPRHTEYSDISGVQPYPIFTNKADIPDRIHKALQPADSVESIDKTLGSDAGWDRYVKMSNADFMKGSFPRQFKDGFYDYVVVQQREDEIRLCKIDMRVKLNQQGKYELYDRESLLTDEERADALMGSHVIKYWGQILFLDRKPAMLSSGPPDQLLAADKSVLPQFKEDWHMKDVEYKQWEYCPLTGDQAHHPIAPPGHRKSVRWGVEHEHDRLEMPRMPHPFSNCMEQVACDLGPRRSSQATGMFSSQ